MKITFRFGLLKIALLLSLLSPSVALADPSDELDAAIAKLQQTTYRKRDHMDALRAFSSGTPPTITECSGTIERLVFEIEIPSFGRMRQERIKSGARAAVRTSAPAIVAKIEDAKRTLTVSSVRSLLRQLASAASAVQTGGLSTASWIREAARAATTIKTTADARIALDRAAAGFASWQLVKEDEDDDAPAFEPAPATVSASEFMKVEKTPGPTPGTFKYTRRLTNAMPGADFFSVVIVDSKTGLPQAEENYVNGQRIVRTEYFDIGAPITIDLPECLK